MFYNNSHSTSTHRYLLLATPHPFFSSPFFPFSHHASSLLPRRPLPGLKAVQALLGFQKYKMGADSALFSQQYADPNQDPNAAPPAGTEYTGYSADMEAPANTDAGYDGTAGYQSQDY